MSSEQVDIRVKVRSIMSMARLDSNEVAFRYPSPSPVAEIPPTKIDPNYVSVQLLFQDKDSRDFVINMVISKEFAKKLSLMVGDKLTLKLVKESE